MKKRKTEVFLIWGENTHNQMHIAINGNNKDEPIIASALYKYYKEDPTQKIILIELYADGYSFIKVTDGKIEFGVTDTPDSIQLDTYKIYELFEAYKSGEKIPVEIEECYSFLKKERMTGLEEIDVTKNVLPFDNKACDNFLRKVMFDNKNFPEKIYRIIHDTYGYSSYHGVIICEEMVHFPEYLQPKGFKSDRVSSYIYKVSAEIDGKLVKATLKYAPSKYGEPNKIELAGKLLKRYIDSVIEDEFFKFALARKSYKVRSVTHIINSYLSGVQDADYRKTGERKPYGSFAINMNEIINHRLALWYKIGEKEIMEVIDFLDKNPDIFMELEEEESTLNMRFFYSWFKERKTERFV